MRISPMTFSQLFHWLATASDWILATLVITEEWFLIVSIIKVSTSFFVEPWKISDDTSDELDNVLISDDR